MKTMTDDPNDLLKKALKEALTEWLEAKYTTLGKWSMAALGAAAIGAIVYALLYIGWRPSV